MSKKQIIVGKFVSKVKGRRYKDDRYVLEHDGSEGHWLEKLMGLTPNGKNEPDILGYEMKKDTSSKTTFGDWSPDKAIWKKSSLGFYLDRDDFLRCFGKSNTEKDGRFSWSGEPSPKIDIYNRYGQILNVDESDNIIVYYCFSEDRRKNKFAIIPPELQVDGVEIAIWSKDIIKKKLENKFNQNGWFKCYKDHDGYYTHIGFGPKIPFEHWIKWVREGVVFFDPGMYEGNRRPYAQWRANNAFWDGLVEEYYK